ncbi:hypothetical protein GCM10025868_19680 [Angustibacter aerolatus]|uniref:Phospholipid/glycerol acyltransferase domain-containing protein n=1 Tax=Angustibacter aerolatus TaxID=1162965 RepID=A0ABQ6JH36_9ACTN|nr:1-acyl-sn-glycerol-3-phosphate acyltransferase [Angustibacter aerolatus]GMA86718.1 hypothetical protein GCM10025868_19680 [Angustibacter aerolatus]
MAKESVFTNRVSGPLMRGMHHISVDRQAGSASFRAALTALKQGEVVGIFPEATISRSFTVKEPEVRRRPDGAGRQGAARAGGGLGRSAADDEGAAAEGSRSAAAAS